MFIESESDSMEKHFKVELNDNKIVNVPVEQVDNFKKNLGITTNEAIVLWLEDNGYETNELQETLDKKAKKTNKNVVKSSTERKPTTRERKANPTKEMVISKMAEMLNTFATNVNIENVGKIITFELENKHFKLDLTEKREKKSE